MPAAFDRCVKKGGKVRTKSFSKGRFQRTCLIDGKMFTTAIKKKKGAK